MSEGELPFRAAETHLHVPRIERRGERARIRRADVLRGGPHEPSGDVERIAAAIEHAREPVQARIRSGAADRLVQRRDLVVEAVAAFVESARGAAGEDHGEQRLVDLGFALALLGEGRGHLEQIERAPRVPVGGIGEHRDERVTHDDASPPYPALGVAERAANDHADIVARQRFQHVDTRAREQCADDLEGRVLGGGADEEQRAVLHVGQEGVLLRLVEPVHLVDEQNGVAAARLPVELCLLDRRADVLDAREDRREGQELRLGVSRDEARERRLAGARRSPEDHRVHLAGLDETPERLPLSQQVPLADELVQGPRTHAIGERAVTGSV